MVLKNTSKLSKVSSDPIDLFSTILFYMSTLDEDIDGVALIGLQNTDITKLLTVSDEDGTIRNPKMRTQRKFRAKLEEYKTLVKQGKKRKKRSK
jgi:hypothetical protein